MENPVILTLYRKWFTDKSTIGELYFGLDSVCFSLEDVVRAWGEKIDGETAIPYGRYEVVLSYSNRFRKYLPLLLNVPKFTGIRIHTGNRPENSSGCILVGTYRSDDQPDYIFDSRKAMKVLMDKLEPALKASKVYLEIIDRKNGTAEILI